ncbi:maleylpyruvate isomerase family mycothiol-dependent enzyme [Nocardioides sp.]|uniref:maleylpyruvate isomerase family mycothiol-dependent enzyme n=1 Tax=Nocardioides sp. TaxID=35761 RepID=UPI00272711F2|nr:maleylpyruvate isomerase family mycothiol-dependent enzyme [Nocardioides sp.]MDO9454839.1 maleylpyruvate isomerase family mycothiol-dependent enzyme [Nocardioides sp.]
MSLDTRLDAATYLDRIRSESARFHAVLSACDPGARVPACPDWDAAELVWHLAGVQWFWSDAMMRRPEGPPDDERRPARADSYGGLLDQYAELSAGLVDALAGADPAEPAWSWADHVPDGRTVGFTFRRQAHEALVHRLDAEQTAGPDTVTPLDPALAADGVAELLEVMYGGAAPAWGRIEPGTHHVRIDLTDTGHALWVQPCTFLGTDPESGKNYDGPHLVVVDDPGTEPSAVVSGTAADLDATWWKRRPADGIEVSGDPAAHAELMAALSPPLD